jgi:medium-chain acyl-[acyl-carrier-protein] hydrolase
MNPARTDKALCTRLFCLPYAGGSSQAYRRWSALLDGVEVVAIDYPGHLMRPGERLSRVMDDLVGRLWQELSPAFDVPFSLCGSSMGSLVAFELARRAEREGIAPSALVVAACPAPDRLPKHPPIAGLPDAPFINALSVRYGGLPSTISGDREAVSLILPMFRADMELYEAYTTTDPAPIATDIIAVVGARDTGAPVEDAARWQGFTSGTAEAYSVAGDHFAVEGEPEQVVGLVARFLSRRLERA